MEKSQLKNKISSIPVDLQDTKVLVVDDNQTNREILMLQLQSWHMNVVCAEGASQALKLMNQALECKQPFSLAILDMNMPEMDGVQLAEKIHANPYFTETRLMMLTSTYSNPNQLARQNVGIIRCATKPVRQQELFEMINDVMRRGNTSSADTITGQDSDLSLALKLKGKVLVAEDNIVNQQVAVAMLTKLGLQADIANNGKEAVDLVCDNSYDIILMDCQMPVMDGFEATSIINKQLHNNLQPAIIALTANASKNDQANCLDAGMDDFLSKPYSSEQLGQILLRWLPKHETNSTSITTPKIAEIMTEANDSAALNPVMLEQIRGLDPSGGGELINKIMRAFLESADNYMQQFEDAIMNEDTESISRIAHTLKSSSANIGAENLSEIFKLLELHGRAGELSDVKALQEDLLKQYQQVLAEIKEMLSKP